MRRLHIEIPLPASCLIQSTSPLSPWVCRVCISRLFVCLLKGVLVCVCRGGVTELSISLFLHLPCSLSICEVNSVRFYLSVCLSLFIYLCFIYLMVVEECYQCVFFFCLFFVFCLILVCVGGGVQCVCEGVGYWEGRVCWGGLH